mgnify:CR=1 FL=1
MKAQSTEIRSVKLELLRAGPTHNQLLSPLTNYIALCGSDGPVTINIPYEHRQLLMRLKRLKYPLDKDPATDDQRQAEHQLVEQKRQHAGLIQRLGAELQQLVGARRQQAFADVEVEARHDDADANAGAIQVGVGLGDAVVAGALADVFGLGALHAVLFDSISSCRRSR